MSLNSLQDDMSRRAASMAAMAKRANNPQEIEAIQKNLVAGVQNGSIQPYVGIPLIQELTERLTEAKAQMAQTMAGTGMQQPPQGQQAPQQPIAQQVMQQATQENQGVEALPSNLPQEYAGGGIIAFEGGGEVERYQNQGIVPQLGYEQLVKLYQTDPQLAREAALRAGPAGQRFLSAVSKFTRAASVPLAVLEGGAAASGFANDVVSGMSPEQRKGMYANPITSAMSGDTGLAAAIQNASGMKPSTMSSGEQIMNALTFFPKTLISAPGDKANPKGYGLTRLLAPDDTASTAAAPVVKADEMNKYIQANKDAKTALNMTPAAAEKRPAAPPASAFPIPSASGFKMPTLVGMDKIEAPTLKNISDLIGDLPTKSKELAENTITKVQKIYEDFDKPGFESREGRLGKRELAQEKDSAINRALNVMNLGFGIAGSKERTLAGALGKEGREGIVDLIKGEAANRAAKDRLEDMRDNLEQQKIAAKKGNYQAAQTAGREASRDLQTATQLTMTGAHYGNTEAIQRYQVQAQDAYHRTATSNQGVLGLAGLDLQKQQLAQNAALGKANLAMQEKRFAAMDATAQARLRQVQANASKDFTINVAPQLNAQFVKEYGPNWRTAQDARSLQAQMLFKQQQDNYLSQAMGLAMDTLGARQADVLLMGQ